MTEFQDLRNTINSALDKAITEHFEAKEKSAVAKFQEARKQRGKKRTDKNRHEQWHETYVIQVARTSKSATIKVEGREPYWTVQEPWVGHGRYNVRQNGGDVIDGGSNLESLIQRTILLALSDAYIVVIE